MLNGGRVMSKLGFPRRAGWMAAGFVAAVLLGACDDKGPVEPIADSIDDLRDGAKKAEKESEGHWE